MLNKKALAGTAGAPKEYVEDVFNTYLTTGAGSAITVVNDIDLSGEGGLVWTKPRNTTGYHVLFDTARGANKGIYTNDVDAESTISNWLSFNNNGFTIGTSNNLATSTTTGVSWTFRKAKKFFDVVTYTGNGANRTIAHNLGSVPGMIIVKRTNTTGAWQVYHRSLANTEYLVLNTTAAKATGATRWNSTTPTSTEFSLGTDATVNANGATYVAYLFAHDAGGFGLSGNDNVISCGSFTAPSSGTLSVNLGYEAQYLLIKRSDSTGDWYVMDNMRGFALTGTPTLSPNTSGAELPVGSSPFDATYRLNPTATGFELTSGAITGTYIYMAIRRPMKKPTSGTQVFSPVAMASAGPIDRFTNNFAADGVFYGNRGSTFFKRFVSRLTGNGFMSTPYTDAESTTGAYWDSNTTFGFDSGAGYDLIQHAFRRAPGFFDVVCYTGTGANRTVTHNLSVAPELIIGKRRSASENWAVYHKDVGNTKVLFLNLTNAEATSSIYWNNTTPTSSSFTVGGTAELNASGSTYVAYLFASLPGVSKVGSYTGNGSSQTINCGFSAGARFVLIKATSTTGDWVVLDTARGIVSGNDPFLQLNSTAAEITNEDIVDPDNSGFVVNSTTEAINTNGVTYIYLAIA